MRKRAALLTYVQQTNRQDNLPEIGQKIAYKANRDGVAERCPDPAVQQSIDVDLALIGHSDDRLRDLELALITTAKQHDAQPWYLLQTVPGIGKMLSLVLLYAIPDIARFPRVQDCVSYGRLVKCAKEAAGKRYGTSGTKIGNASLKWACAEAAVLFLRNNPAGHKYLARLENQHGQGQALTVLAHKLARAVYDMLRRHTAFEMETLLQSYGRGAGEPAASLGHDGLSLAPVLGHARRRASTNAWEHIGPVPGPCALDWTPALAPVHRAEYPVGSCALPLTRT